MVHGRHLEHAQAIGEGSAADFVGALQGVFAATRKIVLESPGVRPLEIACSDLFECSDSHSLAIPQVSCDQHESIVGCLAVPGQNVFGSLPRWWYRANRRSKVSIDASW